jgi:hypothetical protein
MADLCSRHDCSRRIVPGVSMVQVAWGYYFDGAITPTFAHLESEWHRACYEGPIEPQSTPYRCPSCKQQIKHGEYVVYVTIGSAPEEPWVRAEGRGYTMAWIGHKRCPQRKFIGMG